MIGLEYIRKINGDTVETLATKLNITKSLVSQWENRRKPIPQKRLIELSKVYGIPEKYFNKELTKADELTISHHKLSSDYDSSVVEYEEPIAFDSKGNPTEYVTCFDGDRNTAEAMRFTELEIKLERLLQKIRNTIHNNNIDYDDEFTNSDSIIDTQEQNLGLFSKFNLLMNENDAMFLAYILRAVELSNDDSWGENPRLDKSGLTSKVLKAITEWKDEEKKRQEAEYQEYKELFGLDDESEE